MAKTYGFIAASEDRTIYFTQYYGILEHATTHNLGHVEFVEEAEFGLDDPENRNLTKLVEKLDYGDVLIVRDIYRLGRSTYEIMGIFIEILKRKAAVCSVLDKFDIGTDATLRSLPCVLEVLSAARKDLEVIRSKDSTNRKRTDGTVTLGRPAGKLGSSRMDGKEQEIVELLESGLTKSEVALRMCVSRPALHDFCVSRKLLENS